MAWTPLWVSVQKRILAGVFATLHDWYKWWSMQTSKAVPLSQRDSKGIMQLVSCASSAEELRIYFTDMMQGRQNWGMISSSSLFQNVCLCKDTCLWPTAGVLNSVVVDVELLLVAQRLRFWPGVSFCSFEQSRPLNASQPHESGSLIARIYLVACAVFLAHQKSVVYIP